MPGAVVVREPPEPEGGELGRHGIGAHGERPSVHRRLDGRVAESLPGGPEVDDVTRRVGVHDPPAGSERPRTQDAPAPGLGDEALQLRCEAVLGRAE